MPLSPHRQRKAAKELAKMPYPDHQQVMQEADRFKRLLDHWCPEFSLNGEGFDQQLMRAFLAVTACCAEQKRKLDGVPNIRPLESFPDPMVGFKNTPNGF